MRNGTMRRYQDKHIEDACAAMASALAKFVASVAGQASAVSQAGPVASIRSSSPEEASGLIAADPAAATHVVDDLGFQETVRSAHQRLSRRVARMRDAR